VPSSRSTQQFALCSVTNIQDLSPRPIPLPEALRLAVSQSEILHLGTVPGNGQSTILVNPQAAVSTYDVRIRRSGVLYGDRSSAAALTDFNPKLDFNGIWGRNELVQNSLLSSGGIPPGGTLAAETSNFNLGVSKQMMSGGYLSLNQSVQYSQDNVPGRLFPSTYSGNATAEFRQPLMAGAGTEYNSIAGPLFGSLRGVTGVQQGYVIGRINEQISEIEFRRQLQQLLHDVEIVYWQLAYQHHFIDVNAAAIHEAEESVNAAERRSQLGEQDGSAIDLADGRLVLLDLKSQHSQGLLELLQQESLLRRALNLQISDGSVLQPSDEFFTGEFKADCCVGIESAFLWRPELLAQRQQVRSLCLQLEAARSVTAPRLDFVSSYSANAFGDNLLGPGNPPGSQGYGSAATSQFRGDQTGWTLGFQYERPMGLRLGKLQSHNIELKVAKANAVLVAQESEIQHEIIGRIRQIDNAFEQVDIARQRRDELKKRLGAVIARQKAEPGKTSLYEILQARRALADAESQLGHSLMIYQTSLADWNHSCGTTMTSSSMAISDGQLVVDVTERQNDVIY